MSARTLTTVARIYLLGMLLSILPGSWTQVLLKETGGKVTYEGQSVTLTCSASGFNFREYAMSWHRNPTGNHRELVASISPKTGSDKEYSSQVKGRASITRDNGAKTVTLKLDHLRKEDSGKYYCARLVGSFYSISGSINSGIIGIVAQWENFGLGTELTVLPLKKAVEKTVLMESGGGPHQTGKTLKLRCQTSGFEFKTSKLGWYRWTPGHAPLSLTSLNSISADPTEDRITISREETVSRISLQIEGLGLRDSGQYHCVRRVGNGDDTDQLVFGPGTVVTMEPGFQAPLAPSVFLVRSKNTVACLIRNFYPKDLYVSLASSGTLISVQNVSLALIPNGTYSAVQIGKVAENDPVTCSVNHHGKKILVSHQSDYTGTDSGIVSKQKQFCPEQDLIGEPEQGNMLFLNVLGLRLLFVKTVVINVLFTTMTLIF